MAVANLIRPDRKVADIGTDHAYLPVYLVENGISPFIIASDVKKGPLDNAKKTVNQYNMEDFISLRLSDGLKNFAPNEVEDVVVAGMGGLLIKQFIEDTLWLKNNDIHLVLQPMTHIEDLRKTLYDYGFSIDKECASSENGKLYVTISAYYTGESEKYSDYDLIVGKIQYNDDEISKKYLNHMFEKYEKKLIALKNAKKNCERLEQLVGRLSIWQQ